MQRWGWGLRLRGLLCGWRGNESPGGCFAMLWRWLLLTGGRSARARVQGAGPLDCFQA